MWICGWEIPTNFSNIEPRTRNLMIPQYCSEWSVKCISCTSTLYINSLLWKDVFTCISNRHKKLDCKHVQTNICRSFMAWIMKRNLLKLFVILFCSISTLCMVFIYKSEWWLSITCLCTNTFFGDVFMIHKLRVCNYWSKMY